MEIGERIKTLRELRGLTQTELALAMGYKDKSTICKIEANQRDLPRYNGLFFKLGIKKAPPTASCNRRGHEQGRKRTGEKSLKQWNKKER